VSEIPSSRALDDPTEDPPVGVALARLRKRSGLTGAQLGRRLDMSQAKISKIETGAVAAAPADVERIALELGAPADEARALAARAEAAHDHLTDWRLREGGLAAGQLELARVEATTTVFRFFTPAVIPGLLQTTGYARSVLGAAARHLAAAGGHPESVAAVVSARVRRQEVLANRAKRFVFLMTESALQHLVCPPVDMAAQIERLREVGAQDNVTLALLPTRVQLAYPPVHPFSLFDDRLVLVDLINTFLTTRGRADLALFAAVFRELEAQATTDVVPVLDRYQRHHLDLSRHRLAD
jgi:transcriptional regulator with XRE-family HTH domain